MIEGFKFRAEYDNTTQYRVGDGVTHGGKVYICILDTQKHIPITHTGARLLMVYSGKASMIMQIIRKNDLVKYGSRSIFKQDTTGNLPTQTTFWEQFVEALFLRYGTVAFYKSGDLVAMVPNLYPQDSTGTPNRCPIL